MYDEGAEGDDGVQEGVGGVFVLTVSKRCFDFTPFLFISMPMILMR